MTKQQQEYEASLSITYRVAEQLIEYRNFTHPNKEQYFNIYMLLNKKEK